MQNELTVLNAIANSTKLSANEKRAAIVAALRQTPVETLRQIGTQSVLAERQARASLGRYQQATATSVAVSVMALTFAAITAALLVFL